MGAEQALLKKHLPYLSRLPWPKGFNDRSLGAYRDRIGHAEIALVDRNNNIAIVENVMTSFQYFHNSSHFKVLNYYD
jgi:hypothetical protein